MVLAVTFVSGGAPAAFNAASLMQKRYQLAAPAAPDDPSTSRDLYFVGETRCDVAPTVAAMHATVVDPGFCKPVHVASVRTDSEVPFHDAEHWHLTEDEWMYESGRALAQASDDTRTVGRTPDSLTLNHPVRCVLPASQSQRSCAIASSSNWRRERVCTTVCTMCSQIPPVGACLQTNDSARFLQMRYLVDGVYGWCA